MKVLQLIDTLNAGGAERVAVNYANMLSDEFSESHLVTTRASGVLQTQLKDAVVYKNLSKTKTFDLKALKAFKTYLQKHNIKIVHAHTTSYFFAVLTKLLYPKFKLVWHDHQGNRDEITTIKQLPLIFSSLFFNGVICVNNRIKSWAEKNLWCKKVIYIENFVSPVKGFNEDLNLKGTKGKRIVNVANLKPPKNHLQLLQSFKKINDQYSDWSLHLVGKDFQDDYSKELKDFIQLNNLTDSVLIYGLRQDISAILKQCDIGVIASTFEGLPMALLEYGMASLAVLTTDVGNCKDLVETRGVVVNKNDSKALTQGIITLIENEALRNTYSEKMHEYVSLHFGEATISSKIITFYKNLCSA